MTNSNSLQKCNVFEPSLHNGVKCIQSTKPEDQGTVRQIWFTSKLLCEFFDVADRTLRDNVKALVDEGEIAYCDISQCAMNGGNNRKYEVTIYNLDVLNKLGMCCFRGSQKAREIRNKFNDVLVKEETKQNTLPALSKEDQLFLNIIHTNSKEQTAVALNEYKIYRDEREQEIAFERDEAIRTKAFISSKREATLMGKVGGTTKALNVEREKNTKLLKENIDLIKEKEDLKIRLQESDDYKTVRQMTPYLEKYVVINKDSLIRVGKEMTKISKEMFLEVKQVKDVIFKKVNSYNKIVWKEFFIKLNNDPLFLIDIRK